MKTLNSFVSSATTNQPRDPHGSVATKVDGPIDSVPFRHALKYGLGVVWAQRRFAKEVIHARLAARLDVEINRLAVVAVAAKAVDQRRVTEFISELWLGLTSILGKAVAAAEAEMRTHIETVVQDAYAAVKRYDSALEKGELPSTWRDRLVKREEQRTDQIVAKLDHVLDDLIEQRVKLMTGGISLPNMN